VSVLGDATKAVVVGADGKQRAAGANLPVGTYDLRATFSTGVTIDRKALVKVKAEETTVVRCSAAVESCR
jgi:hypothetical protein